MKAHEKTREQLLKDLTALRRKFTKARKALEGLHESEERMRGFMESATEAFLILDENLNILDLNPAALAYLPGGTPRSEVIGRNMLDFVPYLKDTPRYERYREIVRSGGVYHEDGLLLTLGAKQRYLSIRAFKVGEGLGIIASDITERKLAEEALRQSEETFWTLAEQSPNMIFINIGGQVIYANARASEIMGYTRDELYSPGFDFLTLIEPDFVEKVKEAFARHMRGEDIPPCEYALRTKDGQRIEAIIATKLIPYHGKPAILGIVTDITEHKRAERALIESEEKYRRLADIAEEGIAIHDRGMIVEANEALGRMFGYTAAEMIGTYAAKYATPETWELILKHIAAGYTEPYEGRGVRKDGSTFWVELRGKLITYKGRPMRVGVFRDITARKQAEERIRRLNSGLRAIRNVNQLLVSEKDSQRLIKKTCDILLEALHYQAAWIVLLDETGTLVTGAGVGDRIQEFIGSGRGLPPCAAMARRRPGFLPLSSRDEPCRSCALIREGESFEGGCARIEVGGHVYGVLGIHLSPGIPPDEEERALILELAGDIALGLHNIRLEGEHRRAEQALRESEEQFRMLTEQSLMGVHIIQKDRFRYVNEATSRMTGYSIAEILNWGPNEFAKTIHPEDRPLVMEQARKKQAGEADVLTHYQWRMITRSGETKWMESWSKTIMLDNGPADFVTMIDITERKRAEQALRESEEKYRLIAENTRDFISVTDVQGTYLYVSPSHGRYLGYDTESSIGRPAGFIIHPDDNERVTLALAPFYDPDRIREYAEKGESVSPITVEYRVSDSQGNTHYLETIAQLVLDPEGKQHRVIHVGRDITERVRSEEMLRQSEERFRALVEHSADGIAVIGSGGKVIYTAPANDRILGYNPGENPPTATMFDYIHPDDHALLAETFSRLLAEPDRILTIECRARHRDGSWRVIEVTAHNRMADPAIGGIVGNFRDITERKRAEQALRESEERWRSLVENAPNLIVNVDLDGTIRFINHAVPPFTIEEIIGRSLFEFIDPEFRPMVEGVLRTVCRTQEPAHYEVRGTGPNGRSAWYETSAGPILHGGKVTGITLVSTDITDRKRAEESLRQREVERRAIFENVNDAIIYVDDSGTVLDCNRRVKDILGWEPEEAVGRHFSEFPFVDPEKMNEIVAKFGKASATGRAVLLDFPARRADGQPIHIEASTKAADLPGGRRGFLTVVRDITERKRLQERETEAERLRELDRMRTELLANVSHELRTPLTTIKGYASMLHDYPESLNPEERRHYLRTIEKSADRLNELVESLLDMSRLESGLLRMERRPADIGEVLRQALEEARIRSPEHTITANIPPDLPPARFDPKRIRQVLDNILDNAVKYSAKGTTITAQVLRSESGLVVSVTDQGMGIPASEIERVFDRMYRIRTDRTARVSGMGLGLSIAKGIVEAHGGRIWMESIEGKGSTCFFTLPLDAEEAGHDAAKDDPHH